MKHTRFMVTFVLIAALLASGCGQSVTRAPEAASESAQASAPEAAAPDQAEETVLEEPTFERPFVDFPEEMSTEPVSSDPVRVDGSMFRAKFEGTDVEGSGEAVDGVYRFIATKTDGESWHVKLECNYPTVAGRDYFVTYRFRSNVSGTVKFGDFQEFQIHEGENEITGILIASGGTSYLDLQLGMLSPFTIDFTEIEVKEYADDVEYENALTDPINFERESIVYEKHDQGYATILARSDDTVDVYYIASPWDAGVWQSRLYVRTGMIPEAGTHYRVTADIMCTEDLPFEVLFNNGDEEKGYGALYGQELAANEVKKCEAVITGSGNGDELVLQFSLGLAPEDCIVIVGNVNVEIIKDHYTSVLPENFALDAAFDTGEVIDELIPVGYTGAPFGGISYSGTDTIYEQHDDGYVVSLEESAMSATMRISQAPANAGDRGVWKAKLLAETGVSLKPGRTYRIGFDLYSAGNQAEYEVCFDGNDENAYGALYGRSLTAGGTDHVSMLVSPSADRGPLKLRLQLGKTDSAAGNTFTFRNLRVESVQLAYQNVLPGSFSYDTGTAKPKDIRYESVLPESFSYLSGVNVYEQHADGYTQSVSAEDDSASLTIETAPEEGRDLWNSKLYINTGVVPEAGKKYNVSFDISAEKDQPKYEICFDGAKENSYGALYDRTLTAEEKQTVSFAFSPEESDGALILRLQLGQTEDTSGNVITVSDLKVGAVETGDASSVLPDSFAYPTVTTTVPEADEPGYYPVNLPSLSAGEAHDDGYDQTLDGMTLTINAVPTLDLGVWQSKLFVNTGMTPEAGTKYRVTANVSSDKAFDFEICYNNGGAEKGYGALYGQNIGAGAASDYVCEFDVPGGTDAKELVLQFMVGKSPAENNITVNSVKVEKFIPEHETSTQVPAGYKAVAVSLNPWENHDPGYEQTLSGTGLVISGIPESDTGVWKSKLFIGTGVYPEAGVKYKVTANVTTVKALDFEICVNSGAGEKGYGALYGLHLDEAEAGSYVYEFTGDGGELVLQLQLGSSPADNTVTVNSLTLEKWEEESQTTETVPGSYENAEGVSLSASEAHDEGYEQTVSGTALSISRIPTLSNGVWSSKLFVNTHKAPDAGAKYRVTANVTSSAAMDFEVCFNSGDAEKGYGALYGQSIAADETKDLVFEFETPQDAETGDLVLQFQLGNGPAAETFAVNSVVLEKWIDAEETPEVIETVTPNSFELWAHEDYAAVLGGDENTATVRFDATPEGSLEVWKTKLFAETGVTLTAGKAYRISADVKAEEELPYEICYNNGGEEKGVGAKYGLTASRDAETVTFDVTPENDADLVIQFSLGNAAAGNLVTVSNIKVEELEETVGDNLMTDELIAWAPVHTWTDAGYVTELENDDSSATMTVSAVPDDPADWKVKLFVETGAKLKAGKHYRVRYNVEADKAFDYNVFYNNGAEEKAVGEFYGLNTGKIKTVEHIVSPANDAELNIQLMLGMCGAPNKVKVSNVKVDEIIDPTGSVGAHVPINFWAHEDYAAGLSNNASSATLAITKVPASGREAWKVKLFAETGAKLKAGKSYRVSVDVQAAAPTDYEICYNNVEVEKELGALYGLTASSGKQTVTYNVTPGRDAELIIQFGLGNASGRTNFTVSGVKVEEISVHNIVNLIPDFRYNSVGYISKGSDEGYNTTLVKNNGYATFGISRAPAERHTWNAKVNVRTGFYPAAGKGYRVTINVDAAAPQNKFEIFYDGAKELDYGGIYERTLAPGRNTFSFDIMPGAAKGELTLQLRFGETNGQEGNTYTISGLAIEEIIFRHDRRPVINYTSELVAQEGYNTSLEKTPDKDTVRLIKTPAEGKEAWKNKLFVNTGVVLDPQQKYRVSMNVKSIIPAPFEVCYNNGDVEKGLGAIFGLISKPYGQFVEYSAYVKEDTKLAIQLSLGNCSAPNSIILEDVKVEKAGDINLVTDTIYYF